MDLHAVVLLIAQSLVGPSNWLTWEGQPSYTYDVRVLDEKGDEALLHTTRTNRILCSTAFGRLKPGRYTVQVRSRNDHPEPSEWIEMVVEWPGPEPSVMDELGTIVIFVTCFVIGTAILVGFRWSRRRAKIYWIEPGFLNTKDLRP